MGRRRRPIKPHITKHEAHIIDLISLLLDCHPAGYLVLCGRADWPDDEEVAEMLRLRNGSNEPVHVQGGQEIPEAQRRVEAMERARRYVSSALDRHGGVPALVDSMNSFRAQCPQDAELLKRIGMSGMPGAKSLEAIAGEFNMDMKTLYRVRRDALRGIAFDVVYGHGDFELAG